MYNKCFLSSRIQCSYLIQRYIRSRISSFSSNNRCHNIKSLLNNKSSQPKVAIKSDSSVFVPLPLQIKNNGNEIDVGEELTAKLKKADIVNILHQFYKQPEIRKLGEEHGLDGRLFNQSFISFRRYCTESSTLPVDLHIVFNDVLHSAAHVDDLFPYFLRHAQQIFPHLNCMEDLRKISDLRLPANWYPEARAVNRKIVFHVGPTNSGKTHHALERFMSAKSGVYCSPLKMLAVEVYFKAKSKGTPCDLVTGEEKLYANDDQTPVSHVSCTIEMTHLNSKYEVAVIDEIQMIRDLQRGWAWTRALLGLAADEIHLCGEGSAMKLIQSLCSQIGENVEIRQYERLTNLTVENEALEKLDKVRPGDCIVCFSKADIYSVSRSIESLGKQCAVIYGGLPPGTKLAQANKFNDPNDPCKILVATDAIGMGLNLSIRRIIFFSLIKPMLNEQGEKEMNTLSTSQALQIAGRAGRYGTNFSEGYVTTFKRNDLQVLKNILDQPVEPIAAAGLHPTADQIELFAYHLPQATLSNLMDIFISLSQMDDMQYFMCEIENFKFLADMIQHVPLPLRARYVFCCAPINKKFPFACTMFLKYVRQYSKNQPITFNWLCTNVSWPFAIPSTILDLVHLESVYDVIDVYLWLGYRFPDLFPDSKSVRHMQHELDSIIQEGVLKITQLLQNTDKSSDHLAEEEDSFLAHNRKKTSNKAKHRVDLPLEKLVNENTRQDTKDQKTSNIRQSRITDILLAKGLITPEQLDELQRELTADVEKASKTKKDKPRKEEKVAKAKAKSSKEEKMPKAKTKSAKSSKSSKVKKR